MQQTQAKYDNYRREQQAARQAAATRHKMAEMRSTQRLTQVYVVVLVLALVSVVAGVSLLLRQRRLRAERDNAELRARQAELEAQQLRAQEELRRTQHVLEQKNSELTGLVLQVSGKEQLVNTVREELRTVTQQSEGETQQQLRKLQQSLMLNTQAVTSRDSLQQVMEQVHPRFFAALQQRCPDISNSERRLAALLRLNFSSKDIVTTLNISDEGVRKARYRLRRKLGLATEESLTAFLLTLDEHFSSSQSEGFSNE